MSGFEDVKAGDLFGAVDLDGSGYIDRNELAAVCDLDAEDLAEVFDKLDADHDGRISIEEFSENFKKFKNVVSGLKSERRRRAQSLDESYDALKTRLGKNFSTLSGQEYVSELFHYLHSSSDSPQLLALLESFLFSVVRDVKHFSEENHRLEDALKRTCEKHAEHMDQLDEELEQQMSRLESRVRKEERSKSERQNLDVIWQLESKNKELQTLNAKLQKLETKVKKKEPEEQKMKEEYEEKVQELRYMKSQLTDAQTNLAILRSELVQLRSKEEEQSEQLQREKATVLDCVQEQESLTRQLHLLHEANKKLHDTNDDLRSALELKKSPARNGSPLPNKRHSISVLSSNRPSKRSSRSGSRRGSAYLGSEEFNSDPRMSASGPPCFDVTSTPLADKGSSRRDSLLPTQQSCEVDDDNESSLLNELMEATQASDPDDNESDGSDSGSDSDVSQVGHDYKSKTGVLNSRETGRIHHLLPPSQQPCEVDGKGDVEPDPFMGIEPVGLKPHLDTTDGEKANPKKSSEAEQGDQQQPRICHNSPQEGKGSEHIDSIAQQHAQANGTLKQANVSENTESKERSSTPFGRRLGRYLSKITKYNKLNAAGENEQKDGTKNTVGGAIDTKYTRTNHPNRNKENPSNNAKTATNKLGERSDSMHMKNRKELAGSKLKASVSDSNNFSVLRRSSSLKKSRFSNRQQKVASVTFSPTVTVTSRDLRRTKSLTTTRDTRALSSRSRDSTTSADTSDTDSTSQGHSSTYDFGADDENEMDEAYSTMPTSERDALQQQLKILQESNSDLRLALKALSKKGRVSKPKSRKSDEYRHQPSVHSDYGSISSRSITPNHLQGPKSDEDAGDGVDAEELSGYEPEDSTITVEDFQFVCAPKLIKNTATSRDRIDFAAEESNAVMWEDESDTDTLVQQPLSRTSSVETNGPIGSSFDRNASGRKPCRYKSLEHLTGDSNSVKNKNSLPLIVREGKWQSLEQIRKRQEFSGERSKSLPTSRWQSGEKLDFNRGIGLVELSEKLDALRKSQEDVGIDMNEDLDMLDNSKTDQVVDSYILNNYRNELDFDSAELVKALSPTRKPVPLPRQRKIKDCEQDTPHIVPEETDKQSGEVFKSKQTESLPGSEHSTRHEDLSTELEAEFKSVLEEDEDDLDEYDVGDEELAKLVAMTSADTDETDSDSDTETELPEERGAAVGADSLSEASSNTLNTSTRDQTTPERMFKIVLAGDAAVGKSSFILRLCRNRFHSALNSTLGVDFQMKTMEVDGKNIALQLWDTAGQERFRSIAKSYFRKADGVLLLYDVTCETSFLNVREWVDAIEDSSSKSIPIMLCGNKTDLRPEYTAERKTVISAECGQKLAKEYGALFSETSAKDGSNIQHACVELARLLRTIEDDNIGNIGMNLTENDAKSKKRLGNCCKT